MKPLLLLALSTALLAGCAETQPMPRDPYVARKIERMDGNRGDVPGVNHPNLDPSRDRDRYYDDYDGRRDYDRNYYNRDRRYYR